MGIIILALIVADFPLASYGAPAAKTDLILGIGRGISSIWPSGENDRNGYNEQPVYNRLIRKNHNTGEIEPELAKSWDI